MNTMDLSFKPLRFFLSAMLALVMCLFSVSTVLADPATDASDTTEEDLPVVDETFIDDPTGAYVELKAEVPDGFRGSVSVMLMNEATGEMYTITAFRVNYYSNSEHLPYGKYSVEQVYTSEKGLAYEAFIEEDGFDLTANYTLHAKVVHNEDGQSYIDGNFDVDKTPSSGPSTVDTTTPSDTDSSIDTDKDPVSPDDQNTQDTQQEKTPTKQSESSGSVVGYILKVIVGTAVFTGIVFGVVYIVRKNNGF